MFERILYPTDFSHIAKKALGYIKKLKDAGAKEVIVLHVIDEREIENVSQHAGRHMNVQEVEKRWNEYTKQQVKEIEGELKESGFDVRVRIERGIPFTEILRVEEEQGVSIVVLGSHGKSLVKEMLLGSVSENVIRRSKKPVLVIKR